MLQYAVQLTGIQVAGGVSSPAPPPPAPAPAIATEDGTGVFLTETGDRIILE